MESLIDRWLLNLIDIMKHVIKSDLGALQSVAIAIASCAMLIAIGIEAYQIMLGKKGFELGAIAKPFMLGFIIIIWAPFIQLLDVVPNGLEKYFKVKYEENMDIMETKHTERLYYAKALTDSIISRRAAASASRAVATSPGFWQSVSNFGQDLMDSVGDMFRVGEQYIQNAVTGAIDILIEMISKIFFKTAIYFIFFLQTILMSVLSLFGPITWACSIFPIWSSAWSDWIGKYLSIALYSAVAYFVLYFAMSIMQYTLEVDIKVLQMAVEHADDWTNVVITQGGGSAMTYIVSFLLAAFGVLKVPEIVTYIIPSTSSQAGNSFLSTATAYTVGVMTATARQTGKYSTKSVSAIANALGKLKK